MTVLLVAFGGALGALLRYLVDRAVQYRFGSDFPWGTFTVNVTGSAVLGLLIGLAPGDGVMAFAATGLCGAFTTYSTLSYDAYRLAVEGTAVRSASYVVGTTVAGLLAGVIGLLAGSAF
ncbi:CrcB family protein [Actinocorallia sp. A-T 12471]|uniref:fluoride efflux transporter FluC n=1 Tax=Actinocorallia sp. A-T 12471 TaxID=3089813 RepID=UPI0029CBA597|nr:CrcB family protein [Actinocorallia sp. A-T 12471]MDX6741420.1 CrcB family protein [Actinocorallia sp. A-T 12471]